MPKEVYKQKFRDSWLHQPDFKNWMCRDQNDNKAYCKHCKCSINAKLDQIRAHLETKKHIQNSLPFAQANKINFQPVPFNEVWRQEAGLAMFIAQHAAIEPVGHLSELCNSFGAKNIKLHRTKCTNVIKHVLSAHFKEDLRNDIGDEKYSLLIDESTDISITKVLGVAIICYSAQRSEVVSTLMSLISIEKGDALTKTNCLRAELSRLQIPIENLIGIGTDNANVMVCNNKSVYIELKKSVPSLILVKCVCHSVQLTVNAACKQTLPQSLEFIASEVVLQKLR